MDLKTIKPFEGLGDLHFGMERNYIRSILRDDFKAFSRITGKQPDIDYYIKRGLQLNYDENDKLEFIEAFVEANPIFEDIVFFENSIEEILNYITDKGYSIIEDEDGYDFPELGFGLYMPYKEDGLEAVSIYRRNYYEDYKK